MLKEFQNKFKIEELKIFETENWIFSLRPAQCTLGAGVLSLKRPCFAASDLTPEELGNLSLAFKKIEKLLKIHFNYEKINYLMLMMVDAQLHLHVIPRYEKNIEMFGVLWKDEGWKGAPILCDQNPDKEIQHKIVKLLSEEVDI